MRANRLPGHALRYEGRVGMGGMLLANVNGPGQGVGRAQCSCGQDSPVLPNTAQRQRWHRDHKNDIRSELGLAQMDAEAREGRE